MFEKYFYIYHKFMTNDVMYYDVSLLYVSFPNLEELKLNCFSMWKKIWHPQHKFSDKL